MKATPGRSVPASHLDDRAMRLQIEPAHSERSGLSPSAESRKRRARERAVPRAVTAEDDNGMDRHEGPMERR